MPSKVQTIDGPGIVREVESRHGRTYMYVIGRQFEGWYSSMEITSDIGDPGRSVTTPSDFPSPDEGAKLPYDPEPRDLFHDQLNIQPIADLPENLDETNSIKGLRNYEPNAVFGSRFASLPWQDDGEGGYTTTDTQGNYLSLHQENGQWVVSGDGNSPVFQSALNGEGSGGFASPQDAMDAIDQALGIPGRMGMYSATSPSDGWAAQEKMEKGMNASDPINDDFNFNSDNSPVPQNFMSNMLDAEYGPPINGSPQANPMAYSSSYRHPFGKERGARHFATKADDFDDEGDDSKVVPHKDDDPYDQVPGEWESDPPGMSDYGDDYEEKNPPELGGDSFPEKKAGVGDSLKHVWWGDSYDWLNDPSGEKAHPQSHQQPFDPDAPAHDSSGYRHQDGGGDRSVTHAGLKDLIHDQFSNPWDDESPGAYDPGQSFNQGTPSRPSGPGKNDPDDPVWGDAAHSAPALHHADINRETPADWNDIASEEELDNPFSHDGYFDDSHDSHEAYVLGGNYDWIPGSGLSPDSTYNHDPFNDQFDPKQEYYPGALDQQLNSSLKPGDNVHCLPGAIDEETETQLNDNTDFLVDQLDSEYAKLHSVDTIFDIQGNPRNDLHQVTVRADDLEKISRVETQVVETSNGFVVTADTGETVAGYFSSADEAACAQHEISLSHPMTRNAAWGDVRKKALRLRNEGHLKVTYYEPKEIESEVRGDHGLYDVAISRKNAFGNGVTYYSCSCPWGQWAFKRQYKYVGRFCSHGYAAYMEMQSLDNKGARAFNLDMNPFVNNTVDLNTRQADAQGLADPGDQYMSGGSDNSPPLQQPAQQGQPVQADPSHMMEPDGSMQVYGPQMDQGDGNAAGMLQDLADTLSGPGMDDGMGQQPNNFDDDMVGQLQNMQQGDPMDADIEGVEVPHVQDDGMGVDDGLGGDLGVDPDMEVMALPDMQDQTGNYPIPAPIQASVGGDDDLANMARDFLSRTAAKQYDLAQQEELMNERGTASQVNALNLENSLYEEPNATFLAL